MKFEPAQKLSDGKRHRFLFAAILVVLVFKSYTVFCYCNNAVPGNSYLVGIVAKEPFPLSVQYLVITNKAPRAGLKPPLAQRLG